MRLFAGELHSSGWFVAITKCKSLLNNGARSTTEALLTVLDQKETRLEERRQADAAT